MNPKHEHTYSSTNELDRFSTAEILLDKPDFIELLSALGSIHCNGRYITLLFGWHWDISCIYHYSPEKCATAWCHGSTEQWLSKYLMLQVAFSASCSLGEHDNRSVVLKTRCIILHRHVTCFNCELEVLQYKVNFSSFCFATEKSSLQSGWLLCYHHRNTLTVTQVSTIPNVSVCLYLWHASFFFLS